MPGVDVLASAITGANAAFLADLYARWVRDPGSVDASFGDLFAALNDEARGGADRRLRRVLGAAPLHGGRAGAGGGTAKGKAGAKAATATEAAPAAVGRAGRAAALDSLRALMLIRGYRVRGHLEAQLDPLGLQVPKPHPELDPATYGFAQADSTARSSSTACWAARRRPCARSSRSCAAAYCGPIGVEFMHIQDPEQKAWLQKPHRGRALGAAIDAATKPHHPAAADRGGGLRGVLPEALRRHQALRAGGRRGHHPGAARHHRDRGAGGVNEVVIGMPHRGRLNTLVNVVRKPFTALFSEFGGASSKPDDVQGSGDVKYHLGTSTDIEAGGHSVHISLQPNPSHLEAVDPVVVGKVRARQDAAGDTKRGAAR